MLSKDKRLNLKTDFKWAASGKSIQTKYLKLFIKTSNKNLYSKIGVAVSSKVFKEAVERNRAKRVVFAAFEKFYQKLPSSINIVALPNKEVLSVKSDDIARDLESILKKV